MLVEISLYADPEAPARARGAVVEAFEGALSGDRLDDACLLTSEVVTNAIKHAHLGPGDRIGISLASDDRRASVEVSDPGPGFEPQVRDPSRIEKSGWGLFLVDKLADRWGVAGEGPTRVWFEFELRS